jgi:uncharacterized protein
MAQELRFECQPGCTECCRQRGFVYLTELDLLRVAAFLGMSSEAFERQYVYRTRHLLRLRTPRQRRTGKNARCRFLRAGGCSIHPAKPTQCRIFPFWPELAESRRQWRNAAAFCPGIGKGPLVQIETARQQAAEMRESYPKFYPGTARASAVS